MELDLKQIRVPIVLRLWLEVLRRSSKCTQGGPNLVCNFSRDYQVLGLTWMRLWENQIRRSLSHLINWKRRLLWLSHRPRWRWDHPRPLQLTPCGLVTPIMCPPARTLPPLFRLCLASLSSLPIIIIISLQNLNMDWELVEIEALLLICHMW